MSWIILLIAGLLEVVWAVGLKYTHGFSRLTPSIITTPLRPWLSVWRYFPGQ